MPYNMPGGTFNSGLGTADPQNGGWGWGSAVGGPNGGLGDNNGFGGGQSFGPNAGWTGGDGTPDANNFGSHSTGLGGSWGGDAGGGNSSGGGNPFGGSGGNGGLPAPMGSNASSSHDPISDAFHSFFNGAGGNSAPSAPGGSSGDMSGIPRLNTVPLGTPDTLPQQQYNPLSSVSTPGFDSAINKVADLQQQMTINPDGSVKSNGLMLPKLYNDRITPTNSFVQGKNPLTSPQLSTTPVAADPIKYQDQVPQSPGFGQSQVVPRNPFNLQAGNIQPASAPPSSTYSGYGSWSPPPPAVDKGLVGSIASAAATNIPTSAFQLTSSAPPGYQTGGPETPSTPSPTVSPDQVANSVSPSQPSSLFGIGVSPPIAPSQGTQTLKAPDVLGGSMVAKVINSLPAGDQKQHLTDIWATGNRNPPSPEDIAAMKKAIIASATQNPATVPFKAVSSNVPWNYPQYSQNWAFPGISGSKGG